MRFVLVHGLGLSSNIWSQMIPLLDGEVITIDLPGHGNSDSKEYSWAGLWTTIMHSLGHRDWLDTTLVLHSFTASLLPEIVSSGVRPKKIVLLEGILHSDDAIMAKSIVSMDNEIFQHWLKRFRSVSKMTLKSQLISKNHTNDLEEWSDSFKLVKGDALRVMASSLRQRLESDNIAKALTLLTIPQIYIRGENSRLSSACDKFLREKNMNIREIPKSAHFPMIDNPRDLAQLIIEEPL